MSQSIVTNAVPGQILHKLRLVRHRKIWVQIASAIVAAVAVLLAAMAVAMFIDWLATLYDSRWRVVLTIVALAATAFTTIGWLYFAWRRMLGIDRIARDVDRQFPRLEERWTTMTRLGRDATNSEIHHPAMLRRVASEAVRWEPHVEPEQVVSLFTLTRAMIGLTAITAILGLAVMFDSHHTLVLMQRFWRPASPISATELVNMPGNIVVGRGESLALVAALKGTPVDRAKLFLRSDGSDAESLDLIAHGNDPIEFSHRLPAVEQPFEYRFRAGDGQSEWYTVGVAERPEIDAVKLTVTPPAYTHRDAANFDTLPQRISALERSELELAIRPKIAVEHIQLQCKDGKFVELSASDDGWYRWKTILNEALAFSPILTESHGLTNRRVQECAINVYPDQPPAVKILSPDDQMAVRPNDTLEVTFRATDDTGIDGAELVVYEGAANEAVQVASIPIPLGEQQGARAVDGSVDLDLSQFKAENGEELSYEIRVREDRGSQTTNVAPSMPTMAEGKSAANQPLASASPAASQVVQNDKQQKGSTDNKGSQQPAPPSASASPGASQVAQNDKQQEKATSDKGSQQPGQPSASTTPAASQIAQSDKQSTNSDGEKGAPQSGQPSASASPADSQIAKSDQQPAKSPNGAATSPSSSQTANATESKQQPGGASQANADPTKQANAATPKDKPPAAGGNQSTTTPPEKVAAKSEAMPKADEKAREATSGRQIVSSAMPKDEKEGSKSPQNKSSAAAESSKVASASQSPSDSKSSNSAPNNSKEMPESDGQPKADQQASSKSQNSSANSAAKSEPDQSASSSTPSPPDNMTKRSLDVPAQSSSSNRMRLKIDEFAGSFSGQQRAKVEMAIAPELEALDKALAKGQQTAGGVLDQLKAEAGAWRESHSRDVTSAERTTVDAQAIIDKLKDRSKDTPYAFIGLQVVDVGLAHVDPARADFWKALQSEGDERPQSVRSGWQHLGRARELVAELRGQFERTRREFQLAESMEKVKKMYQVYIENSHQLLQIQDTDPDRYNRKMAELEMDDDYLKRLQEVMEMRRDLEAELARILGDDPRLLRRFMDSLRNRSISLREELAKLVAAQNDLNREVRAWTLVEEADRPQIAQILLKRQVQDIGTIAAAAGELQSRYQAWLPLDRQSKDADLAAATKTIQEVATVAGELNAAAARFVADAGAVQPPTPEAVAGSAAAEATQSQPLDTMLSDAQRLYKELTNLQVALRQISARDQDLESAAFASNRLVETQRLITSTSAWIRQTRAHKEGNYAAAAEVDQYRLAMKTDELAGKLGSIEQTIGAVLDADGKVPEPIAAKAREFIAILDKEAAPNQLGAVYALHSNQLPRAGERQKAAGDALTKAEAVYDDLMRLAITEMDKLPVQDPIADLLDDPTLDELLAQLEQEIPLQELLGIPNRPSNLRIIGDWLRPGSGDGGGGRQMANSQMRQDQQRARRQLDKAYRRALARALQEAKPKQIFQVPKGGKLSDWNQLVSHLGDDIRQGRDKAPPEQYRRAIEQYFAEISRIASESEAKAP